MPFPSVTYNFSNGSTADADAVDQNFTDIINGISDGTKDISVNAGTFAGNVSISGNTTLGNASSDTITFTGSMASTLPIGTTNSYDIGSSTLGLRACYFGANSQTVNIKGSSSMSATWTFTLPVSAGSASQWLLTDGSGVGSWSSTTTVGKFVDGSADEIQMRVQGHSTQTSNIVSVEKSDATSLLAVTNTSGTNIRGTTTNDSAAAGFVGEELNGNLARSSASAQTAGATTNVTSISVTAGDWDISGAVSWRTAGTTTAFYAGTNTTSATLGGGDTYGNGGSSGTITITVEGVSIASAKDYTISIPSFRVKLSATTTIYLVQQSDGTNNKPCGYITARRRR